ncbi:hypothetical protein Taro_031368 [Colocasia esculenta]|uniref:Uncharacterized protein n=1 Tax=Colocasia esculenta TaxID=4460 RepID=A0A843VIP2_COLES|nr:hypothetical protein [Colocasia esculenta]
MTPSPPFPPNLLSQSRKLEIPSCGRSPGPASSLPSSSRPATVRPVTSRHRGGSDLLSDPCRRNGGGPLQMRRRRSNPCTHADPAAAAPLHGEFYAQGQYMEKENEERLQVLAFVFRSVPLLLRREDQLASGGVSSCGTVHSVPLG